MAGGNLFAKLSQKISSTVLNNTEVLKDSSHQFNKTPQGGILKPGESIDFNKETTQRQDKPRVVDFLKQEETLLITQDKNKEQKLIDDLQREIHSLIPINEGLSSDVTNIPLENISNSGIYHPNRLNRIRSYLKRNSSESKDWNEISNNRKNKRFLNRAQHGGQKYRESREHTVARSAN